MRKNYLIYIIIILIVIGIIFILINTKEREITTEVKFYKISDMKTQSSILPAHITNCKTNQDCAYIIDRDECPLSINKCNNLDYIAPGNLFSKNLNESCDKCVGNASFWEKLCNKHISEWTESEINYVEEVGENACNMHQFCRQCELWSKCDASKVVTDDSIECECKLSYTQPEFCVINQTTGEEVCGWIEDTDYTYCAKVEESKKPDMTILNLDIKPENPKVNELVFFPTTIKNIGNGNCSEIHLHHNFDNGMATTLIITYPCFYDINLPCFEPGQEATSDLPYGGWKYNSSGEYNVRAYIICVNPESNYENNNMNKTIIISDY